MTLIERLNEQDWQAARAVRLRALTLDPSAFGSTTEREQALTETDWRERLNSGIWLVARTEGAEPVGLATVRRLDGENADFEINSMWVQPELRGQRIGERLLDAALDAAGTRRIRLWVTVGNEAATRLYVRHGFVPTGRTEPLLSDPRSTVAEYVLEPA